MEESRRACGGQVGRTGQPVGSGRKRLHARPQHRACPPPAPRHARGRDARPPAGRGFPPAGSSQARAREPASIRSTWWQGGTHLRLHDALHVGRPAVLAGHQHAGGVDDALAHHNLLHLSVGRAFKRGQAAGCGSQAGGRRTARLHQQGYRRPMNRRGRPDKLGQTSPVNTLQHPPCRPGCPSSGGTAAQRPPAGQGGAATRASGGCRRAEAAAPANADTRQPALLLQAIPCLPACRRPAVTHLALLRHLLLVLGLIQLQALLGAAGQLLAVVLLHKG